VYNTRKEVSMIIVEGPDGGGKSTLVNFLHEKTGMPLSPDSMLSDVERNDPEFRSQEAVRDRVYQSILSSVGGAEAPEIHDRMFYSELIYSHAYGRECAFTWGEQQHICRVLIACRCPVFFCIPPLTELRKKVFASDHMEGVVENIIKIYNSYVMIAKFSTRKRIKGVTNRDQPYDYSWPRIYPYDYTNKKHKDRALRLTMEYIDLRKRRGGGWYEGPAPYQNELQQYG
jgi:hypothetical protein